MNAGAGHVSLRIDRIAVEIGQDQRAEQAEETIRKALALLAGRLSQAPLGLAGSAPSIALEFLDVGPLDPQWLGGPGAADRLAEHLYRRLLDGPALPGGVDDR
ncbi:hypothetical protein GCM10009789_03080 [Kribbella sancticallisti]|uniref:Uncharacterized protein n=1 Tax=Kribbella sancticallisti TaxID=460087 RepID=A0ABN2C601_9ACTN